MPHASSGYAITERLTERLYGRDAETRVLLDAFARSSSGGVATVLIAGRAGIGKSALVRALYVPVAQRRGYFAAGKGERLHRVTPFGALSGALDDLLGQVLAAADLASWRPRIADALGDTAGSLCALIPRLEHVLGTPLPSAALAPEVAQHRLQSALIRLIQLFARTQHPLVLFIDDVQWADAAGVQLLTRLAGSEATESLLLIEAYRDHELDPGHPFAIALHGRSRQRATASMIALSPLPLAATAELIGDALQVPPAQVTDLAVLIHDKTAGNPLCMRQLLGALHEAELIQAAPAGQQIALASSALDAAQILEHVADLPARALAQMPEPTRALLVSAAALGQRFDVATLAIAHGRSAADIDHALVPAVAGGLLAPAGRAAWLGDCFVEHVRYTFLHDRIHRAVYDSVSPGERERLHLEIGRALLSSVDPAQIQTSHRLFEIVSHLGHGRGLISAPSERTRFCELAIAAARRARRAGAFDIAASLYEAVRAMSRWSSHYAMLFEVHKELAESLVQGGNHAQARAVIESALPEAAQRDRAVLEGLAVLVHLATGQFADALAAMHRGVALLGIELPSEPAELSRQIEAELALVMAGVTVQPVAEWLAFPPMRDPDSLVVMRLFANALPGAYQHAPQLLALMVTKMVTLSLQHGNCGESARGYGALAILLWTLANYELAFAFGQLSMSLVRQVGDAGLMPAVDFTFSSMVSPWQRPVDESIELLGRTRETALEAGDALHAGYAALFEAMYRHVRGAPLPELADDIRRVMKLCARLGLTEIEEWTAGWAEHIAYWSGAGPDPSIGFDASDRELLASKGPTTRLVSLRLLELERRYWRGEHREVLALAASVAPMTPSVPGYLGIAELPFYRCLSALELGELGEPFDADRAVLARYAAACRHNFAHHALLVDAELARYRGDIAGALAAYDQAITSASDSGFVKVEVIAHELAARFWARQGKAAFGAVHLGRARDLCEQWGALPRARELEQRRRGWSAPVDGVSTTGSTQSVAARIDFVAIVKASQAIANEVMLDSLLAKVMPIIVENAGAQAGAIVLETDGALAVHAASSGRVVRAIPGGSPLSDVGGASEGIVRYAMRMSEAVALDDAGRHPSFRNDPYVRARRPRSVLCMPIVHNDHAIGAVYLENNLVTGAFTVERLEALGVLVGQLAISIENALMFARLSAYRDHLEQLVEERTQALTGANQQLREQAAIRERIEAELRLAQKLQSVGQLSAGVAHEINTPIQYVGDSVMFLRQAVDALLGVLDAHRAATDPATGEVELAAVDAAEQDADLDYLRTHVPEACARATDGVDRVTQIVRAMKAFSRPDQVTQTQTSINAALESTLVVARNEYRHVADVATDFGELPPVVCHAGEINQVFLNLIVNAAHAIEHVVGAGLERGMISIATRRDGDMVVITIGDSGGGIPEAIRDRIFDPFFTTKEVGKGTGQGLTLARTAVVDRHAGMIQFECPAGGGTIFTIRLPIAGRAATTAAPVAAAPSAAASADYAVH